MPDWLLKTGKSIYYEESIRNDPSKPFSIEEIPKDILQKIKDLPLPEVLGWYNAENKEFTVYKFLDKIYIGPEHLKEGLREAINNLLTSEYTPIVSSPLPPPTKEKAIEISSHTPHSSIEEKDVEISLHPPFLEEKKSSIIDLINRDILPPIQRDAASQDDLLKTNFPPGHLIISNFKEKQYSLITSIDSLACYIEDWSEDHYNQNFDYSVLDFLEICNEIFKLTQDTIEKLIETEIKNLSPSFQRLSNQSEEKKNILFASWMQLPENIERLKIECENRIKENPIFKKMDDLIDKIITEENISKSEILKDKKDSFEIFNFWIDSTLKGAASYPKIKLGPPPGSFIESLAETENLPKITEEDYSQANKKKSKIHGIVLIPTLFFEDIEGNPSHFVNKIPVRFFSEKEITRRKNEFY